jgi:hypothetical protein
MAYFNFINDEDLIFCISKVINTANRAADKAESDLGKNVLDPFAALFSFTYNNIKLDEWSGLERERQSQKSIQNSIGDFHQNLLGNFKGWQNAGRGGSVDLINEDRKIIAEVKNKHNTMNSSAANNTYDKLADHLKYDRKDYLAYLVQIVPKSGKNYNNAWSPNLKTMALRDDIRRIDGESFYDLASCETNTLSRIFDVMPEIIAKILGKKIISQDSIKQCKELFVKVYK